MFETNERLNGVAMSQMSSAQSAQRGDTRQRLLDAAEVLFAERGMAGTALRAVTAAAGVNLAAVNYHFGGKEQLLEAVVSRRIQPVNAERLRRLDELEATAGDGAVPLVELVRALLEPMVRARHQMHDEAALFPRLMGRLLTESGACVHALIGEQFQEVAARFTRALGQALPHLSPAEVLWRLHFCVGSLAFTLLHAWHLGEMSGGLCSGSDPEAIMTHLLPFVVAGFEAPASGGREA
jgi:AcrR family transcriptional regulator